MARCVERQPRYSPKQLNYVWSVLALDKKSIRYHMFLHMSVGGFRLWQRFLRIFICRIFLSVYQIWNSFGFRYSASYIDDEPAGNGGPIFLQIPLSTGSIRGGTSTFDCKCRHPCGIGKAVYMEGRNTGCGRVVKPYVLSPVLQMDLSSWRSLCAF